MPEYEEVTTRPTTTSEAFEMGENVAYGPVLKNRASQLMFFGIILATKVIAYTYTFHLCWMFIYKDVVLSYSYSNVFVVLPWSQIINF